MTYSRDDERMAAAIKSNDGFFATFLVSSYSPHIVRWAADRRITPNQVTAVSAVLALAATGVFASGTRIGLVVGAVLVQACFTADCVDGQLARYTATGSALGVWLDAVSDRAKEFAIYAGLAIGGARTGDDSIWLLAICALALQASRHQADFAFSAMCGEHRERGQAGGGAAAGVRAAAAFERSWLKWIKRIIVLPIGERFALISVTAALFEPRVVFQALLAWGGVGAVYMVSGRLLRSLARAPRRPEPDAAAGGMRHTTSAQALLASYRDDGPVAVTLRRVAPSRLPASWTAGLAAVALAAGLLLDGERTATASFLGVGLFVVLGAATGASRGHGRLRWIVPPLLHAGEYATLIVLAWRTGVPPAAFALLAVVAYHHYELVYLRGAARLPRPVDLLAGGWDGRILLLTVAGAADVFAGVTVALAVWATLLFGVAAGQRVLTLADPATAEGRAR